MKREIRAWRRAGGMLEVQGIEDGCIEWGVCGHPETIPSAAMHCAWQYGWGRAEVRAAVDAILFRGQKTARRRCGGGS